MSAKTVGWVEIIAGTLIAIIGAPFGLTPLGVSLIMAGVGTELSILLTPKMPSPTQAPIQGTTIQTDAYANLAYGTNRYGGILAYENTSGTNYGVLDMVVAHVITDPARGVDGFGSFWLNDLELRVRPATPWQANHVYAIGDSILDSNQNAQVCVTTGTSGAAQPPWKTEKGGITDDNTAEWKMVGTHASDFTWDSGTLGVDGFIRPVAGTDYIHGHVTGDIFAGMVELWAYVGTQQQFADIDPTLYNTYGSDLNLPYAQTAIGTGVVWTHWRFTPGTDPEKFQTAFGDTLPYKLEAIIRGEQVLDVRTATTAYSENPALIARDFLTRPRANGGCEIPASVVDDTNSVIPSANVCDQLVTFADGTEGPRFACNGAVQIGSNCIDELQSIVGTMAGFIVGRSLSAENGAPIAFYSGSYSSPSGTIDESYLRGATQFLTPTQDINYNNVRATFTDQNNAYQSMAAPPVPALDSTTFQAWLAEDGGFEIDLQLQLDFVTDADHAQMVGTIIANQSRYLETVKLECNFKAMAYNVFDRIWLANAELGIDGDVYRITRMTLRPDFSVDVYLMRDDVSVWGSTIPQIGPIVGDPYVRHSIAPVPTGLIVSPQVWGHLIQWDPPDPTYVARTEVWMGPTETGDYALLGRVAGNSFSNHVPAHTLDWYELRASNSYGLSDYCMPVSAFSGDALDPGDAVFDDLIINPSFELTSNWTGGAFSVGGYAGSQCYVLTAPVATAVYAMQTDSQGNDRYIPVTPGDLLYLSVRVRKLQGNASYVVQLTGFDSNYANPNYTLQLVNPAQSSSWPVSRALFQVPAGVYFVRPSMHINNDGTTKTIVGFDEFHMYKNSFEYTNVTPTTASQAFSYDYDATTQVLTISWDDTLEIYWADGSTTTIAAGSHNFTVATPAPGNPLAQYAYPYWPLLTTGPVTFALAGIYGSQSAAAAQEQNLIQNVPLAAGPIVVYVSSTGGGGTGLGGGGQCVHPELEFTVLRAGHPLDCVARDLLSGDEVLTPAGAAPIERITRGTDDHYIRITLESGANMIVTDSEPMIQPDMTEIPARDLRLGDMLAGYRCHHIVAGLARHTDDEPSVRLHLGAPHRFFPRADLPLLHNTFKF